MTFYHVQRNWDGQKLSNQDISIVDVALGGLALHWSV